MAQTTPQPKTNTQVVKPNNVNVKANKQTITDENGQIVRELYYISINNEKGSLQINVGQKTYDQIKKLE